MRSARRQLSEATVRRFFKSLDRDGNGTLSLDEFLEVPAR
jgi:Ca2+-binding EF-hand superfamily protein